MLKLKSQLTCSYCSQIYKDPILMPCDDSICREHLSERNVVKENEIKFNECNKEFAVKENEFKSSNVLTKLVESQSYLSVDETTIKHELEVSVRKFFEFHDKFIQIKTQLESNVFEYFQEMRFQIDEQREKLKEKIDVIALKMIDQIKEYEEIYSKSLKDKL